MNKFYGTVGYGISSVDETGIATDRIVEKIYTGDVIRNTRRWSSSEHLNDNLEISNRISILADPYAYHNFHSIKYVTWMGVKWKVPSVEVQYPRLILDVGGVYTE